MIKKTVKVDYKLKDVHFEDGVLVDENGEVVDALKELETVFGTREFELSAKYQNVSEHEVEDFA